jgi:hypothetical protein
MAHLKVGSIVRIVGYCPDFNGEVGTILARDGEYYKIDLDGIILYDLYACELEVVT